MLPPRKSSDKYCTLSQSCSFSLSVSSCFLSLSLSCFFSVPRTATQQWDDCPPSCKDNDCNPSPPNNNDHQDPNWQRAMTTTTTTTQRQQLMMTTHKQQQAPMTTTTMQQWRRAWITAHRFNDNQHPHPHHPQITMVMCLQRTRYVWKVQYTPNPVERKPSEYISIAMGGSESVRGSSLAFSKQDRKCRHNP